MLIDEQLRTWIQSWSLLRVLCRILFICACYTFYIHLKLHMTERRRMVAANTCMVISYIQADATDTSQHGGLHNISLQVNTNS